MNNKEQKLLGGGGYLKINNNNLSSYQDNNLSSCIKDSVISNITNNINNKAFSLIELSIVLIIMGLLVAGIMGGSSLIQAAKIRATINEYYEYKTAYNSYYERYRKIPGENPNEPGFIYQFTGFKDLCDKGFINQECIEANSTTYLILSKLGNKIFWNLQEWTYDPLGRDWKNSNVLLIGEVFTSIANIGSSKLLTYKEAYAIESKIDDGKADSGVCRAVGNSSPLRFGADDGKRNTRLYFKMDF